MKNFSNSEMSKKQIAKENRRRMIGAQASYQKALRASTRKQGNRRNFRKGV